MNCLDFMNQVEILSLKVQDLADDIYGFRFSNATVKPGNIGDLAEKCDEAAKALRELERRRFPGDRRPSDG